jgi:hypothetical protein
LKRLHCSASRLGLALLEFVDRSLRQPDALTKFGLAPPENGTCQPYFRSKTMPFDPVQIP